MGECGDCHIIAAHRLHSVVWKCGDACFVCDKVQRGEQPDDFKPMPGIGQGVEEIRIWDESGTYRVVYTARLADAVIVLHAFQKKTQTTLKRDIDLAKERFTEFMKGQK